MRRRPPKNPAADLPTTFLIDEAGQLCAQIGRQIVAFELSPDEMREFAAALVDAADRMEAQAAKAATAALGRAGARLQ